MEPNQNKGLNMAFTSRLKPLTEELQTLSLNSGLRWDIVLDTKLPGFVFRVLGGLDRTHGNGINSHALFDPEFDNLFNQEFLDTWFNFANAAYVGGTGEGTEREIVAAWQGSEPMGLNRWETFVDARNVEGSGELLTKGLERLKEIPGELSLAGEVSGRANLVYGKDYNLGDFVTVRNRSWGVRLDTRITEVTEAWTQEGYKLSLQFGSGKPTLAAALKSRLKDIQNEITR